MNTRPLLTRRFRALAIHLDGQGKLPLWTLRLAILLCLSIPNLGRCVEYRYSFDALIDGGLTSQDGWRADPAASTFNGQVSAGAGIPSPGKVVSSAVGANVRALRVFGDFFNGTEKYATLQFDFQLKNPGTSGRMALGGDGTSGTLDSNFSGKFSPQLMVSAGTNQATFSVYPKTTPYGQYNSTFATPVAQTVTGLTNGNWYQVRLVMDLTANSGNGVGSVSYRDLTAGSSGYTYPSNLQNIPLGLVIGTTAGFRAGDWNQAWLRFDSLSTVTSLPFDNLFVSGTALQTRYYISPNGSDSAPNDGLSVGAAFKTLEKARDTVRAITATMTGDIEVVLLDGTYPRTTPLALTSLDSGRNGHHVIWRADAGAHPVISGGKSLTNWYVSESSKNIWASTTLSASPSPETRQLYINGRRATRARSTGPLSNATHSSTGHTTTDSLATWKNKGDMEMVYQKYWSQSRCAVADITASGGLTTITMQQPGWGYCRALVPQIAATTPVYYENAYELLDQEGEWYLDRTGTVGGSAGQFFYKPTVADAMASNTPAVAAIAEQLLTITGTVDQPAEYIQFQGITFKYTTWLYPSSDYGHADTQATIHQGSDPTNMLTKAAVTATSGRHLAFDRCEFSDLGGAGVNLITGSQNVTIQGCRFVNLAASGIQIGVPDSNVNSYAPTDPKHLHKDIVVSSNYFNNIGIEYQSAVAIFAAWPRNLLIDHNEISNVNYTGISVGWGWEMAGITANNLNKITNNWITDVMQKLEDGGAIYLVGHSGNATERGTISGNLIENFTGDHHSIYFDNSSSNYDVSKNIFNTPGGFGPSGWNQMHLRIDGGSAVSSVNNLHAGSFSAVNFDDLTSGALTGSSSDSTQLGGSGNQSVWYADAAIPTAVVQIANGTGGNAYYTPGTKVATATPNTGGRALRMCSPFFVGNETNAVMEFDFQKVNNGGTVSFSLAGNRDPVATIPANAQMRYSPRISVQNNGLTGAIFSVSPKASHGVWASATQASVAGLVDQHWYRVTLTMNFGANNYDGSGTLTYKDLSVANGTPIPALQGINLGLTYNAPNFVNIPGSLQNNNVMTSDATNGFSYSKSPNWISLQTGGSIAVPTLFQGPGDYPPAAEAIGSVVGLLPAYSDIAY